MSQKSGTFFVKGEKIVLKRDGTWMADGIEITHEQTRDLFYKAIQWDADEKKYCLRVGYECLFIEVEDTPFFVVALEHLPDGATVARLSNFEKQVLRSGDLSYVGKSLYLALSNGQRARFLSAPFYHLLENLEEDELAYFLTISGERAILLRKDPANPDGRPGDPARS